MASDGTLLFDTKVDDTGLKKGTKNIEKETQTLGGKVKQSVSNLGSSIGKTAVKIGKTAIKATTAATAAFSVASVKIGSDFESAMSQVAATMGITTEEIANGSREFDMLTASAREWGAATMFSASDAAEALNYIALAGIGADDAVKLLPKTLNLAAAGGMELGYTTDIVTDSMTALGLEISELDGFIDQMAKTSQKSNTNVGQLGEAILTVGGNAKDLAGGTVELNTALGILANNGYKGAEGGTKLRNVIQSLSAPTDTAAKSMEALGFSAYDAEGELRPLSDSFQELNMKMADMTTKERKEWLSSVFNARDLAAVSALLAANAVSVEDVGTAMAAAGVDVEGLGINLLGLAESLDEFTDKSDFVSHAMETWGLTSEQAGILYDGLVSSIIESGSAWEELEEQIANSEGAAQDMMDTMTDNLKGDIDEMKSALEELMITFYDTFDLSLRESVQAATGTIEELTLAFRGISADELNESLKEAGLNLDELGISTVQAILSMEQFETKADFVSSAMEKWGLSEEQAGSLFDTLSEKMENTGDTVELVADVFISTIENMIQKAMELLPSFLEFGGHVITAVVDGLIRGLPLLIETGADLILNLAEGFENNSGEIVAKGLELVVTLGDAIISAVPKLIKAGLAIIKGILKGIIENLPTIIEQGPRLINEFSNAIFGAIPQIIKAGFEIIVALVKGLIEAIPTLIANIPQIILAIVNVFTLYNWAQVGKNLIEKLGKGIVDAGKKIPQIFKDIMTKGLEAIKNMIKDFFSVGGKVGSETAKGAASKAGEMTASGTGLGNALKNGILSLGEAIKNAAGSIASKAANFVGSKVGEFTAKGKALIQGLANGATSAGSLVSNACSTVLNGAKSVVSSFVGAFTSLGGNIVSGIASGIKAGVGMVTSAASWVMDKAKSAAKKRADIHSPSRVMAREVGKPLTQGIAKGMTDAEQSIVIAMNQISDGILTRMKANNEKMNIFQQREQAENNEKLKNLQIRHIDTAYQMFGELQKQRIEETEAELAKLAEEHEGKKSKKISEAQKTELENQKKLLEDKKKNLEDYHNSFVSTYDKIVSDYESAVQKIESTSESLKEKLISYGDVIDQVRDAEGNVIKDEFGNDMLKLTDLDGQIQQITEYRNLMLQLEARGADVDVMSKFLTMSVDDAVNYGKLLMEQSDQNWDDYMRKMAIKRTIAEDASKKFYQLQLSQIDSEYKQKLTENLGEIVGSSEEIGKKSAEALAKGLAENTGPFEQAVQDIISRANAALGEELNSIQSKADRQVSNTMERAQQMLNELNINVYGQNDYSDRQQAYDYGDSIAREMRRKGVVPNW